MKKRRVQSNAKRRPKRRTEKQSKAQHNLIAIRAYQLYLARGAAEGDALRDWLEAEREIGGQDDSRESR